VILNKDEKQKLAENALKKHTTSGANALLNVHHISGSSPD
jgi:hypothetical protein